MTAGFCDCVDIRNTEDVDIVGNPLGLHLITAAMKEHSDFRLDADGSWRYQSASNISVTIELLAEAGYPGSVLPPLNGKLNIRINGIEVHVATLPGLALTKIQAVIDRGDPDDTEDLKWCLEEIAMKGMDMSSEDFVVLQQVVEELVDVADEAMVKLFLRVGVMV